MTDNGAKALADRIGNALGMEGIAVENVASMGAADQWISDDALARRLAAAILANGSMFLTAEEAEHLCQWPVRCHLDPELTEPSREAVQ